MKMNTDKIHEAIWVTISVRNPWHCDIKHQVTLWRWSPSWEWIQACIFHFKWRWRKRVKLILPFSTIKMAEAGGVSSHHTNECPVPLLREEDVPWGPVRWGVPLIRDASSQSTTLLTIQLRLQSGEVGETSQPKPKARTAMQCQVAGPTSAGREGSADIPRPADPHAKCYTLVTRGATCAPSTSMSSKLQWSNKNTECLIWAPSSYIHI